MSTPMARPTRTTRPRAWRPTLPPAPYETDWKPVPGVWTAMIVGDLEYVYTAFRYEELGSAGTLIYCPNVPPDEAVRNLLTVRQDSARAAGRANRKPRPWRRFIPPVAPGTRHIELED